MRVIWKMSEGRGCYLKQKLSSYMGGGGSIVEFLKVDLVWHDLWANHLILSGHLLFTNPRAGNFVCQVKSIQTLFIERTHLNTQSICHIALTTPQHLQYNQSPDLYYWGLIYSNYCIILFENMQSWCISRI